MHSNKSLNEYIIFYTDNNLFCKFINFLIQKMTVVFNYILGMTTIQRCGISSCFDHLKLSLVSHRIRICLHAKLGKCL